MTMLFTSIAVFLSTTALAPLQDDNPIVLKLTDDGISVIVVEGFTSRIAGAYRDTVGQLSEDELKQFMRITIAGAGGDKIPLIGGYRLVDDRLEFHPRFNLQPGKKYRVELVANPKDETAETITKEIAVPKPEKKPAVVLQIYPTAERLPQNLLKFYIQFSQPMRRGVAYDHIRLLDEQGQAQPHSFVELPQELWDPQSKRFTLLFDPGRIKRGLQPNEELGPPLLPDHQYTLVIDASWPDRHGEPLKKEFRKTFSVTQPDRTQPDHERWILGEPPRNSRQPLRLKFNEPLDRAMLESSIGVTDIDGNEIAGEITIDQGEMRWSFVPSANWNRGSYTIIIDANLEDRAGNSLANPFEMKLEDGENVSDESQIPNRHLEFDIR